MTIYCIITTSDTGPDLIEFDSERDRLEWLAQQDDAFEDFYSFEVEGSISGLTIPNTGRHAREELEELV